MDIRVSYRGMSSTFDAELEDLARASDRPTYNTAAVEQRTGIRPATFRAWERRYGFPRPRRLPGNQRLYSDRDISAICWLQRRTDEGLSISHAVRLLQDRLREGPVPRHQLVSGRPPAALAVDLSRALSTLDTHAAEGVLTEAFALYPVERVCLGVIEPMLVEIGERWHRGEVSVATEHFATTFVRRKLYALFNAYETGRGRGLIFTACAPDEWHEVGILMVSLFLVRTGFRVSYLGPNLGAEGLADTLQRHEPDVLCVSATSEETGERLAEFGSLIERLPEPRPKLAYGGQAFADPARREGVPGVYLGPDAGSAVATIEGLLSGSEEQANGGRARAASAAHP